MENIIKSEGYDPKASHRSLKHENVGFDLLLVEDSDTDYYVMERILKRHMPMGCEILRATTIAEAEEMLETHPQIDAVLLDLGLPDSESPHDTYSRLAAYKDRMPIVILTSLEDHTMALDMLEVGAQDYVYKNLIIRQPELLCHVVEFAIGRHESFKLSKSDMQRELDQTSELLSLMGGSYSAGH